MNRFARRNSLLLLMLTLSGGVSAVGLGELRGQPVLGQPMQLEIDLLGAEKQKIEASCFRLVPPSGSDDLPWLRKAGFSVRQGAQPVLEIRSDAPLREPILQLAIQLACGHEVSRSYILMAAPPGSDAAPVMEPRLPNAALPADRQPVRAPVRVRSVAVAGDQAPPRLSARRAERRPQSRGLPDRLMLSEGGVDAEPSLRLATDLFIGSASAREAQREILRLEFRMLMAMHEQATSQMATAEKLRNMEGTLEELQLRAAEFSRRVETNGAAPAADSIAPGASVPSAAPPPVATSSSVGEEPARAQKKSPAPVVEEASGLSEWSLYGVLIGSVLGLAAWLGWRNYRAKQAEATRAKASSRPLVQNDPVRDEDLWESDGVDLGFEPDGTGAPMQVDFELDAGSESHSGRSDTPKSGQAHGVDPLMSIAATTLDEHFEANPVMELADIMLSFGRVKGAAQALQEYIDHSPQDALQPWIRLMDVYRMAGMRVEFENVARNLNQNFNVEVQSWDDTPTVLGLSSLESGSAEPPRPQTLEELPRLINTIVTLWNSGDVVGYIYQLLRDNRGGQRLGFSLPVVEDLLFLIELKETANRMEKSDE